MRRDAGRNGKWNSNIAPNATCDRVRRHEGAAVADGSMADEFPGIGHRYNVDFGAFRTQLHFISETQMTYSPLDKDGKVGDPNPVTIAILPIRDQRFLVTWTEEEGMTVVHLEDYKMMTIVTNITPPGKPLVQFSGTMTQVA
jgi:hypothetical protein